MPYRHVPHFSRRAAEGGGFEPPIPHQEGFMQTIAADREHRGEQRVGKMGNMPIWHSPSGILGESRAFVVPEQNSGCEVALQVLGSLPVTSSRSFIGEPR